MKHYYIGSVSVFVDADVSPYFIGRVHSVVKEWEVDGSEEVSGITLSSVHISRNIAQFYCSGFYRCVMGEINVMDMFPGTKEVKRYL